MLVPSWKNVNISTLLEADVVDGALPPLHLIVDPPAHVTEWAPPYVIITVNDLPATLAGSVTVKLPDVVTLCIEPLAKLTVYDELVVLVSVSVYCVTVILLLNV